MAFNPFHKFRKHQRTIFAVLVIICMFVFILQFGAGDAVSRALNWFGAGKGRGQLVATLHGTKVYEQDLRKLARQREMAANIVIFAAANGDHNPQNPLATLADRVLSFARFGQPPFGPFNRNEDLLDFIIWRQLADQLGIVLTEADVGRAIERVAGSGKKILGGKPFTSSRLMEEALRSTQKLSRDMSPKDVLEAVADEFRVLIAKEAVLGHAPGAFGMFSQIEGGSPAITPAEFLQYYRDQRATLRVWMLPVKVEDFLAEARKKAPPSEKILEDLFQQYKNVEPSPDRDRPAFKEPARVKVAWVSASPDLPYFKEQARLRIELPDALAKLPTPQAAVSASIAAQFAQATSAIAAAPGSGAPFVLFGPAPYFFDRSLARYADYHARERMPVLMTFESKRSLHDRSLTHPAPLGFVIGNALAAGMNPATGTAALPAVASAWFGPASAYESAEIQRMISAQVAVVGNLLTPTVGGGVNLLPLGPAAYTAPIRYALPLDKEGRPTPLYNAYWQVRDRLREDIRNDEVAAVLDSEMSALSKEIAKLKATPEEAETKIQEAGKKLGLRLGSIPTALDRFDLEKDEALKKVREDYIDSRGGGRAEDFSDYLLKSLTAPYDPKEFRRLKGDTYLVWQTEMVKAREPRSLAEVHDKVLDAWYLREARTLARKEAEALSAEAKKKKKEGARLDDIESDLRKEAKNDGFTLRNVARVVSEEALQGARGRVYRPYTVDTSKIEHPRSNLVDQLVKQLKTPGDAVVVSDKPERNYYVALLEHRDDLTSDKAMEQFIKDVFGKTPNDDQFWNDYLMPTKRRDYEKLVMRQLREDAGAPLKDGEYDLPDIGSPTGDRGGEGD